MKRILITTLTVMLFGVVCNAQLVQHTLEAQLIAQNLTKSTKPNKDIPTLLNELKTKGYVVSKDDVKDINDLERYLALDTKLKSKQDSVNKLFTDLSNDFSFLTDEHTDIIRSMQEFSNMDKNIKDRFKRKNSFYSDENNYLHKFLNDYETEINNRYDSKDFKRYLSSTVDAVKQAKNYQKLDSVRVDKEKTEIASLPTKSAVKAKFRMYTHSTGNVFELFPVGFTPKPNKTVIDKVFGRKARYREVNSEGINTLVIDYYNSGNIMEVWVYKGGDMIYNAQYRDHAKQAYEILSKSADFNYEVYHKRTYDISNGKTTIDTKYTYVPLEYKYQ